MIAAGKVSEGCQLLCLINKALDACRYMQTYGQWHQAIWLAKSTLEEGDSAQVLKRYVDHLCSANVNLKSYAILVWKWENVLCWRTRPCAYYLKQSCVFDINGSHFIRRFC